MFAISKYEMKFEYYTNCIIVCDKINGQVEAYWLFVVLIDTKALSGVDVCVRGKGIVSLFCFARFGSSGYLREFMEIGISTQDLQWGLSTCGSASWFDGITSFCSI